MATTTNFDRYNYFVTSVYQPTICTVSTWWQGVKWFFSCAANLPYSLFPSLFPSSPSLANEIPLRSIPGSSEDFECYHHPPREIPGDRDLH
jgi:hypothetical protein